jgi:acetyltransferase-like isoleucine patch superfamily enzyme
MITGLGIYKKYRILFAHLNLLRFRLRNYLLGFDIANQYIQRVDKFSMQLILKRYGANIGSNCVIETGQVFHNCKKYSNLNIGNNCHIGKNCFFDLRGEITIKDNVVISMQCTFITHTDLSNSFLSKYYSSVSGKIFIDHDSYLGANSTLLMNTSIGNNVLIAAGSVVNKNVNSNSMVGGVPARLIKKIS